jgi:hypothetical protein
MNDITRIPDADTSQMSAVDLRAYCDHNSKMRESADISKIVPALVRAQAAMVNPPRNRSVQVRTQAGSYTFRYATLDKITDMTREALAQNGLCVLQPIVSTERGPALVTRLLHESGQWMECEVGLPALGQNPQAFGSAVTYVRRYAISAMLNIAPDEDDDANRAAGNHYVDVAPRKERGDPPGSSPGAKGPPARDGDAKGAAELAGGESAEALARALVNRARVAEGVEEGHALLEAWLRGIAALETLRGSKAWEVLERELGAGLKRALGVDPAAAFVAALRAADAPHVAALQQHWEGKWSDTLSAMQQEAPATYALLRRHVAQQIARVRSTAAGAEEAGKAAKPDAEAPLFEAHLRDETGEVASDPITDPVAFAQSYATAWWATDEDARPDLARHNVKALAKASKHAAARAVLDGIAAGEVQAAEAKPARRKVA